MKNIILAIALIFTNQIAQATPSSSLKEKAITIATAVAQAEGTFVKKQCTKNLIEAVGFGVKNHQNVGKTFSIPLGNNGCDNHYSVDVIFDQEGQFLASYLVNM